MTRSGLWLVRGIGLVAATGLVLVVGGAVTAMRVGSWLAVPDLAALELTVVIALGLTTMSVLAIGRRALGLEAWTRVPGWRGRLERIALIWCMSLAAVLGVVPGLALGLGPPAGWPLALVALAALAARTLGAEPPRRVVWLLSTSYGLAAVSSLVIVRHVL